MTPARRRCRICFQIVDVYTPTGSRKRSAKMHSFQGAECSGSFGPTDEPALAAREDAATRRWAATHTGDLTEYLREKGESR